MNDLIKNSEPFESGHWLNPFKEKITGIHLIKDLDGKRIEVDLALTLNELKLDVKRETLLSLGIIAWSFHTPIEHLYGPYGQPAGLQRTGELYVTLTLDCKKNPLSIELQKQLANNLPT